MRNKPANYQIPAPTPPEPLRSTGKLSRTSRNALRQLLRHMEMHGQSISKRAIQIRHLLAALILSLVMTATAQQPKCYDAGQQGADKIAANQNMFRSSGVVKPYQVAVVTVDGAKAPTIAGAPAGSKTTIVATPTQTRITTTYANGKTSCWTHQPGTAEGIKIMAPKAMPKCEPSTMPKLGIVKPYNQPIIENRQHTNRSGGGDGTNPGGHGNANGYKNPAGVAKGMPIH